MPQGWKCCVPATAMAGSRDAGDAVSWAALELRLGHGSSAGPAGSGVYGLCGVFPGSASQTRQHREALPRGDSGESATSRTDTLPAAQLLCKQFWAWVLVLFIWLHKIFKFEKKTQTPQHLKIFPENSIFRLLLLGRVPGPSAPGAAVSILSSDVLWSDLATGPCPK